MQNSYKVNCNTKSSFSLREIRQVFNDWVRKLLPIGQDSKDSQRVTQGLESSNPGTTKSDAVFLTWQETPSGEFFALYNVTAENHPLYCSTVSDKTLREQNLKIPQTPPPKRNMKRFDLEK